jgi:hypothetical protein
MLLATNIHTVVFPKKGHMRFAGQATRSNKFAIFWAADNRNIVINVPRGKLDLRKLVLRITLPSFGNTTVLLLDGLHEGSKSKVCHHFNGHIFSPLF